MTYELKFLPLSGRGPRFCAVAYETRTEPSGERLVVVVIVDITERLRAEEALKDADRRKDEFLAILAHKLRNPLAPIRNGLQAMRLSSVEKAHLGERVGTLSAERVEQIIAGLRFLQATYFGG